MFLSKTFISCVVSFICLLGWPKNLAYIKREKSDPRQRKTHKTFPRLCSIRIVQYITENYFLQDAKLTRLFWRNLQPEACLVKIRTTKEQSACAIRTRFAMLPKKCRQAKIFFVSADFVVQATFDNRSSDVRKQYQRILKTRTPRLSQIIDKTYLDT